MSTAAFAYGTGDQNVYTGVWVNWSRGRIFGSTVTLTSRDGALLVAFLALFISLVGTSVWRIGCFTLHHFFSTEAPRDALHHQRQIILRNSANATYGLWTMIQTLWAWRRNERRPDRPYRRILPLVIPTILLIAAFATAGTFSSKIATAMGHEVLVTSQNCGTLYPGDDSDYQELLRSYYPNTATEIVSAANYAQQCYPTTNQNCRQYVKERLPATVVRNATCPFRPDMCRLANGNIVFDTGYLDSHSDLGINAPPEDRVTLRRVTSCAPLVIEGYKESVKGINWDSNFTRYLYGPQDFSWDTTRDLTWEYPEFSVREFYATNATTSDRQVFTLGGFEHRLLGDGTAQQSTTSFTPIPALESTKTDTVILFLSANWVFFATEVNDPFYSAHRKLGSGGGSRDPEVFLADEASSPVACKIQQQFCYPALSGEARCEDFAGEYDDSGAYQYEERQKPAYLWTSTVMSQLHDVYHIASTLRESALASKFHKMGNLQGSVPDDQWQIDLEYMHNITLANLQSAVVTIAKGPSDPDLLQYIVPPSDPESRKLCANQKVFSRAHFNFSLFWLALTLALGTALLLLSYALEPLSHRVHRPRRRRWPLPPPLRNASSPLDSYTRLEWATNETLQLQRLAHEELGVGPWAGCVDAVPTTADGKRRLAVLDVSDPRHPRLKAPAASLEEEMARAAAAGRDGEDGGGGGGAVPVRVEVEEGGSVGSSGGEADAGGGPEKEAEQTVVERDGGSGRWLRGWRGLWGMGRG